MYTINFIRLSLTEFAVSEYSHNFCNNGCSYVLSGYMQTLPASWPSCLFVIFLSQVSTTFSMIFSYLAMLEGCGGEREMDRWTCIVCMYASLSVSVKKTVIVQDPSSYMLGSAAVSASQEIKNKTFKIFV